MRKSRFVPGFIFSLLLGGRRSMGVLEARRRSCRLCLVVLQPLGGHGKDILVRKSEFIVAIVGVLFRAPLTLGWTKILQL